jgi:hypothetical protein
MDEQILKLKAKLKEAKIQGLALDIDDTLSDTNIHWFSSMFEFSSISGKNLSNLVRDYKFIERVPEWNNEKDFAYMEYLTHSEEFNEAAPLIVDSNHIVSKINKIIPITAYVTARPKTVIAGTKRWLDKHGFPEATLITRPAGIKSTGIDLIHRNVWKASVLKYLYPEIIGIVDDNYGLMVELEKLDYEGTHFLYGKQHEEVKNHKNLIVCPTWEDVLSAVTAKS